MRCSAPGIQAIVYTEHKIKYRKIACMYIYVCGPAVCEYEPLTVDKKREALVHFDVLDGGH